MAIIGILLIQVIAVYAQPIDDYATIGTSTIIPEVSEPQTSSTANAENSSTTAEAEVTETQNSSATNAESVPTTIEPSTEETEATEETEETETTVPPTSTTEDAETTVEPPVLCDEGVAFLPAPQCNDYYMCLYGVGILKSCPDGLYWDPRWNICNWDSSRCDNGLPESNCSDGVEFLPVESDCTQYIQCVHNSPIQMTCPGYLFWNQPLQRCDYKCEF